MIQGRCRPSFLQESALVLRIGDSVMREDLDGDGTVETRIGGAKHFTHSSRADGSFDVVRAELTASAEHFRDRSGLIALVSRL